MSPLMSAFQPSRSVIVNAASRRRLVSARSASFAVTKPRRHAPRMVAPLPDDTALDMLSFALSGPAVIAVVSIAFPAVAAVLSFADVGPSRPNSLQSVTFLLRIVVPKPTRAELPDGSVKLLRQGETLLRLHSYDACTAVGRALQAPGVSYAVYRADASGIRSLTVYPKSFDVREGTWPKGVVQRSDENEPQARWEEYERLGQSSDIDREWRKVIDRLSPIQSVAPGDCKLCGGSGLVRCHRCGGMGRNAGAFVCDCSDGRRKCEWCSSTGS